MTPLYAARCAGLLSLVFAVTACDSNKQPAGPSTQPAALIPAPVQTTPLNAPFAFSTSRDTHAVIYVVDREGGQERRLTTGVYPDWSRDGRIAYESLGGGKKLGIFVINEDGSGERFVGEGEDPSWSPDGRYVAVAHNNSIYVLDVDGSAAPRIVARPPAGWAGALTPAWSPDGTQIAFAACTGFVTQWDIGMDCGPLFLVAADGSSAPVPLTMTGGATQPAWSPDGRQLAYSSVANIFVTSLGGAPQQVAKGYNPAWTPDGRLIYHWIWNQSQGMRIILNEHGAERILIPDQPQGARNYSDSSAVVRR